MSISIKEAAVFVAVLWLQFSFVINPANAQAVLYDNLDNVAFDNDWLTALGPDRKFAQQFLTGDTTSVDRVTVKLQRPIAGARGSLSFELWRDNGSNQPVPVDDAAAKIADLGTILDVEQIPVGTFGDFAFDNLVHGLEPDSAYWVVADFSGLKNISGGEQSVGWAFVADPDPDDGIRNLDADAGTHGASSPPL